MRNPVMCFVAVSALPLLLLGCPGEEEETGEGEGEAAGEGEGEPAGEGEGEPAGEGEGEPGEGEGEPEDTIVDIVVGDDRFDTLEAAVIAAELNDDLSGAGPFTVFAPTDDAFAALPEGLVETLLADPTGLLADVLKYHVVSGAVTAAQIVGLTEAETLLGEDIDIQVDDGTVLNGRVQVIITDIAASNGVIHVIDAVLVPGEFPGSIADVVIASPRFSTLLTAASAAAPAIVEKLAGAGPITLFAPTNAAFAAVPEAQLAGLLLPENQSLLTDVLLYHVLDSKVLAADVMNGLNAETLLNGNTLLFNVNAAGVFIYEVEVTAFDIEANNGVMHVISSVLIPD
jgi:transforming growth factor-beta-induced protein